MMNTHGEKSKWSSPGLIVYGAVGDLTQGAATIKQFGGSDGFLLQMPSGAIVPIGDAPHLGS